MQVSVDQIMQMPNAAILAKRLETALFEERQKRQHFYEIIVENKKMEFINGEIYFQSPVNLRHSQALKNLLTLLNTFVVRNEAGFVGFEKILVSLTRNDYEPDICFFEKHKSKDFTPTQMQFPAPDFVVEVLSPSTEEHDRETKFQDYAAHGVREYWIVDAEHDLIEQYVLKGEQGEQYELFLKAKDGTIECVVLPELKIQIRSVFDEQTNLEELRRLI